MTLYLWCALTIILENADSETINLPPSNISNTHSKSISSPSKDLSVLFGCTGEISSDSHNSEDTNAFEDAKNEEPILVDNNEETRFKFEFNAYKSNRKVLPAGTLRTYYACKVTTCPAKYHVDTKSTKETQPAVYTLCHNHLAPEKPRLLPEVRKNFQRRISDGANIALLHREAVLEAENPSSATVPTRKQLHDMKFEATRRARMSGNDFLYCFYVPMLINSR